MARDRLFDELRVDLGLLEKLRGHAGSDGVADGDAEAPVDLDAPEAGATRRDDGAPESVDSDSADAAVEPGADDAPAEPGTDDEHPLDAVATRTADGVEPSDVDASSIADAGAYGPAPAEPATDGGNEWTGDDPISFDADDDQDGQSLLDAVTFDPQPDDAASDDAASGEDGTDPEASTGDGAVVDEAEPRDDAGSEEPIAPASDASGPDGTDDGAQADALADTRADARDDPQTDGSVDELEDRVASMEDQQAAVAANVEALESDVQGLHGELRTVRSDLETLVGLVKEAAPTRGAASSAAAAEPAAEPDEAQSATDDAETEDSTPSEATESVATAEPVEGEASSADAGTAESVAARAAETVEQTASRASGDRSVADQRRDDPSIADPHGDERSVADPRGDDRSVTDPRSEAAEERLRSFRQQFEDGPQRSVEHDGATESEDDVSDATAFEFTKVLYPPEDDAGPPEIVGDNAEKPYLDGLPEGFAVEAAVIEWLDGIVARTDEETTVQAVDFYESIGWITPSVRDTLVGYVEGVGDVEPASGPTAPPADLSLEDHRRSLEYVTMLATGEVSADGL